MLEIGLLGGYSTIWMARALPRGGRIVSLEFSPKHAEVARAKPEPRRPSRRVDIRVGPALDTRPHASASLRSFFDLIFIDADKPSNPHYLELGLEARPPR